MKLRQLSVSLLIVVAAAISSRASDELNIIYINADDLGVMDVGFNNEAYKTPNIDQLRTEGMLFRHAYAPAANCAPSRACVMSGQYSPRHGVFTVGSSSRGSSRNRKLIPIKNTKHLSLDMLTLPAALKRNGYKTIHLGKWHLGEDPTQQGFDINVGGGKAGSPGKTYFMPVKSGHPLDKYNDQYPRKTHLASVLGDQAAKFIHQQKGEDQPFFLHMAYFLIHTPLQAVPEMVDKYSERGKKRASYASMIEKMDESIGTILKALDDAGLRDRTLVVFTSDNGAHSDVSPQKPHRSGKGSYFEGGIREPLVVRWPGKVKPGSSCDVPVCGIDFFPTFLEAAGINVPKGKLFDGHSLVPLLTQTGEIPERSIFWHFPVYLQAYAGVADDSHDPLFRTRPGSAMRSGKWKFHEYFEDGRFELYDLEADPGERNDLASTMPEKVAEFKKVLYDWRAETKAPVPTKLNPDFSLGGQPDKSKDKQKKRRQSKKSPSSESSAR